MQPKLIGKSYKINISGIEIDVSRKKIKNLRLAVYPPEGKVKISAPLFIQEEAIKAFVSAKLEWIIKHREKYSGIRLKPEPQYAGGDILFFFGCDYTLNIIEGGRKNGVAVSDGGLTLFIKRGSTKAQRRKVIEEWQRERLKDISLPLIAKWEEVAGVKINELGIKKMKTRWGSCNIRAKRIWLNLELAKKSIGCLEFIILHELVHLLERNHNVRFKEYMSRFMPDWRLRNKELKPASGN